MRVIMTGGGTGGHIYPAIALADKIKEKNPDAQIIFAGTERGLESTLVPKNGYELRKITVSGFNRKNLLKNVKTAVDLAKGMAQSKKLIKEFKPDVVIGTGGYVCGPVVKAAGKAGIRCFIHEQNAYPGMTNKMLEPYVEKVFLGFERAGMYFKDKDKQVFTGNPVRKSFFEISKEEAREALGIPQDDFVILSFGGSGGAGRINKAMISVAEKISGMEKTTLYFATGKNYYDAVISEFKEKGIKQNDNIHLMEYIDEMDKYLNAADVIVARAGALSLAEITVAGKCAVLIPSPNVTGNHQYHNAKAVSDRDGAFLIEEKDLTDEILFEKLMVLKNDEELCRKMGENARKCAYDDAVEKIYGEIFG